MKSQRLKIDAVRPIAVVPAPKIQCSAPITGIPLSKIRSRTHLPVFQRQKPMERS